ncbi:complement C3-like [Salarias fasciatus]|uniref:complement C3-like n=1 Tax=Salarias fasciatus TaxID=181472 RepID=UPI001176848F|nr:complement C3-like [Salarias fasciatus]
MASGRRMDGLHVWCLALLASFLLIPLTDGSPMKVMSAPSLLRIGTAENIFVECQDCTNDPDFAVEIRVSNFPTKSKTLASTSVILTSANKFQNFAEIKIPAEFFKRDTDQKQYVYLQAQFPDVTLEKIVLVSLQSGYIFIQTDKTLYTPSSKVHFRIFGVSPRMEPVERDAVTRTDASISIEFVTPEGIILPHEPVSLKSGIFSGHFQLAEIVSFGLWKVVARFQSTPQTNFFAEFEVKDYVLPSFEVKLMQETPFFYVDSEELTVNIKATYLFGEQVDGSAFGVFGVIHEGQKRSFPGSLQKVSVEAGHGAVTLKREHITQTFENIHDLVGSSIFVAVNVMTDSGKEMAEAQLKGIQIVTSPYTILFKKTPSYFKPGLSFDITLEVVNPDGSPAQGVLLMTADDVQGTTTDRGMARLSVNTVDKPEPMTITVKTNDSRISPERQAQASMTVHPYISQSNSYIHIGVDTMQVALGDNLKLNLNLKKQDQEENDLTYLILNKGQLVKFGRFRLKGQTMVSLMVPITKEMLPSFRIVAYYHPTDKEVVSDSVWVDVKDSCIGSLKLEAIRPSPYYMPRKLFSLKITGDPEATVGLVAVDKGVYLLNDKHRLSQKKVWDIVEHYDTGCTPGGGKDSMGVFYDAGLLFQSNMAFGTPYRQEPNCAAPSRRKRETVMNVTTTLLSLYEDELQRDCCLDGMRDTPVSYSCERRSEYIVDGRACVIAFLHCCMEMEKHHAVQKETELRLARSEEDDSSFMDTSEIVSRTHFPESWLWTDIELPACTQQKCDTTSLRKDIPLQDSITTWNFIGISLSKTHGICVADPLEIVVRKDFFIDLILPYSAVRGEQLEIQAVLHNYDPNPITVRVELIEEQHVCSAASRRGKFQQVVRVGAQNTHSVPFIIIPTRDGEYRVEVKAAVQDTSVSDGVMKMLRVVPEGRLIKSSQVITLDPSNKGEDGKQVEIINSRIPRTEFVPNSPTSTQIAVTGRQNPNMLKNTISGESMDALIYQPSGCGEENMIHMTLPVIATTYLDKTNQWEAVGIGRRDETLQHIGTGYQSQLAYRKRDGSFAMYQNQQGSTWLTAYVVKVFSMAHNLVAVQSQVICDGVKFLIANAQQPDGLFREVGRLSHREMTGDVFGTDSDASMTAFCLIAMQESRTICAAAVPSLQGSVDKAMAYLEKRLPSLINPYAIAMTSYALATENRLNREMLFMFASPDLSHWPVPGGRFYTMEATAYALLALVKVKAFGEARPVVRWLNLQRRENGGFGSTQATIMVYQAVGEYWTSKKEEDYFLNVDVLLAGRSKPDKYSFSWENPFMTRTSKINDINQDVKVSATGPGEAKLTVMSLYYALSKEKESNCQKFNLSVQLMPETMGDDEKIYKLKIEVLHKEQRRDASMSVLEVGMPTGFTANTKDLDLLSKGRARTIGRYRVNSAESDRGSVMIYLGKVSHSQPDEITFRIHQTLKVGILQPAAVSVYEFNSDNYRPETHCVRFYHPERRSGELLRLCRNDECTCAEENCSKQKTGKINNDVRTAKICETEVNSRTDFVYKVRLEEFSDGLSTDIYTMQVLEAIKEGSYDIGPQGKRRVFLGYQHCRRALNLQLNNTYLLMGTPQDIYKDDQNNVYQYVLGERTWIEYWPTEEECQTEEYESICDGMDEMTQEYNVNGCRS